MQNFPKNLPEKGRHIMDTHYHIVFGCDEHYISYAAVAMRSIVDSLRIEGSTTAGGGK